MKKEFYDRNKYVPTERRGLPKKVTAPNPKEEAILLFSKEPPKLGKDFERDMDESMNAFMKEYEKGIRK